MSARNIALSLVNLGPTEDGLTKMDSTPIEGNKAGLLLGSILGNFVGSIIQQIEKMNACSLGSRWDLHEV